MNGEQKQFKHGDLVYVMSRKRAKIHCIFSHINDQGKAYMHKVEDGKDVRRSIKDVYFVSESSETEEQRTERSGAIEKLAVKNKEIQDRKEIAQKKKDSFTITQRFQILESLVRLVALGKRKGLIITGEGGLGKTHTVMAVLDELNFKQEILQSDLAPPEEDEENEGGRTTDINVVINSNFEEQKNALGLDRKIKVLGLSKKGESKEDENGTVVAEGEDGDYIVIGGFATAKGLYNTVFEHRNKLIIFDDCDEVLTDKTARNILKMLLDSKPRRFVSWMSAGKHGSAPKQYEFFGEIIFISNLHKNKMDSAFRTRCSKVDVSMTPDEKIERMTTIKNSPKYMPEVSMEVKNKALKLIADNRYADNVSMRTLEEVIIYQVEEPETWEMLSEYSMYS